MPPESAEQKTEKPTPRKKRRAREDGQVAESMELGHAVVLFAGVGALVLFGRQVWHILCHGVTSRLGNLYVPEMTREGAVAVLRESMGILSKAAIPFMLCVGSFALVCGLVQKGVIFSTKKLVPDIGNIDPVKGVKNLFSLQALMRFFVSVVKIAVIALVAYFLIKSRLPWFASLLGKNAWVVLDTGSRLVSSVLWRVVVVMAAIAVVDYTYQKKRHEKQMMMTKTEVKEEKKREEGRPEVKSRQGQMRRQLANSRMMQAVPEADVVVTNPTHLAVALQWDDQHMGAPKVVAKGQNLIAEKIKTIAREHGVPILERKPLAQALYKAVEIDEEIPPKLYYAVAKVLAFVMKKRQKRR